MIYNGDRTVKYEILSYELIDDKETRISLFFMDFNTRITTFPKLFDDEPRQKLHCYVVFAEKMIYNSLGYNGGYDHVLSQTIREDCFEGSR